MKHDIRTAHRCFPSRGSPGKNVVLELEITVAGRLPGKLALAEAPNADYTLFHHICKQRTVNPKKTSPSALTTALELVLPARSSLTLRQLQRSIMFKY